MTRQQEVGHVKRPVKRPYCKFTDDGNLCIQVSKNSSPPLPNTHTYFMKQQQKRIERMDDSEEQREKISISYTVNGLSIKERIRMQERKKETKPLSQLFNTDQAPHSQMSRSARWPTFYPLVLHPHTPSTYIETEYVFDSVMQVLPQKLLSVMWVYSHNKF